MSITFKAYERTETLTNLGTVTEMVGTDGTIGLIPNNFNNPKVRVSVVLKKKDGTSALLTCSEKVSNGLRDKTIALGQLISFPITSGENEVPYISMPSGSALMEFKISELKSVAYKASTVDYDSLIAL
jgi:hypothetical protein